MKRFLTWLSNLLWSLSARLGTLAHDLEPWEMWMVADRSTRERVFVDHEDGWAAVEREIERIAAGGGQASVSSAVLTVGQANRLPAHLLPHRHMRGVPFDA